ncbi:MAG: DNA oxidative demethylase AlkB [Gammaproteobacteria bacterium]|nr:DNA oxidative demethylase AlkB [Gammaproteobacteria bacterium]
MTLDLFADDTRTGSREFLGEGAVVLRQFASPHVDAVFSALHDIEAHAPFRHMVTPGGFRMSVAMTNCGEYGWVSDRRGYRYDANDPLTAHRWPALPEVFLTLARTAAEAAGFPEFIPDACLVNRYGPGTRLSLHQDKNERDFAAPIVSVSLGLPAVFLFGGPQRADKCLRVPLAHGDVVVWGGPVRLHFHGVMPLKAGEHPRTGETRINLTFRKAG